MILLIKPQFEAGKEKVEKGGVVRSKAVHEEVIDNVIACAKTLEYTIKGLTYSSIKGPSGNIEYLIWISSEGKDDVGFDVSEVVNEAFEVLK